MERRKYMRMKHGDLPVDFVKHYNLLAKVTKDGYVYIEIHKGMYGLTHAGILDQELLLKRLNAKGYIQINLTLVLWTQSRQPIAFTLCVDDFGIKFVGIENFDHLLKALHENYTVSTYWEGTR